MEVNSSLPYHHRSAALDIWSGLETGLRLDEDLFDDASSCVVSLPKPVAIVLARIIPDNDFLRGEIAWARPIHYVNGETSNSLTTTPGQELSRNERKSLLRPHPLIVLGEYRHPSIPGSFLAVVPCSHGFQHPLSIRAVPANNYTRHSQGSFEDHNGLPTLIPLFVPVVVSKSLVMRHDPSLRPLLPLILDGTDFQKLWGDLDLIPE
ncbi:hypothetical protein CVT24_002817 [Panaeolus cyanescens]|uniref:Uncharacterized protein n=1 Tax=Panaeolus cyanescens TaxID=181874 RepID=A0A409YXZ3_9AGAR|nr:hypothetical protein CVT24_002817 [Panaeolus cyanescens]